MPERKMHNLDNNTANLIRQIQECANLQLADVFIFGTIAKYVASGREEYNQRSPVNVAIVKTKTFDVHLFYTSLSKHIVINQEIERSSDVYFFQSNRFVVQCYLIDDLSTFLHDRFQFTIDLLSYDSKNEKIIDLTDFGIKHITSSPVVIQCVASHEKWNANNILEFAVKASELSDILVEPKQFEALKAIDIKLLKETASRSFVDVITRIFAGRYPGSGVRFILDTFADSKSWLLDYIFNMLTSMDVPIQEGDLSDSILSDKRLKLIDVYSDFYLFDKKYAETKQEENQRLTTVLRLLFDSPSLNIKKPYIEQISAMSAINDENSTFGETAKITLFEVPPGCEYGQCPPCDPNNCDPKCCCCHSVDIISQANFRCHKQVVLSCNNDGTSPGPGEDPFSPECSSCFDACETILGLGSHAGMDCDNLISHGQSEGWWQLPSIYSPCECTCHMPGTPCNLTCVTCFGLFCSSNVNVSGSDCKYNITLSPGPDCCGNSAAILFMLVIDRADRNGEIKLDNINQIDMLIDNLAATNLNIKLGLSACGGGELGDVSVGGNNPLPQLVSDFTNDYELIKTYVHNVLSEPLSGILPIDTNVITIAALDRFASWQHGQNYMLYMSGNESVFGTGNDAPPDYAIDTAISSLSNYQIKCFLAETTLLAVSSARLRIMNASGGGMCSWAEVGSSAITDSFGFSGFESSCKCIDESSIKVRRNSPECKCCKNGVTNPCVDDPSDADCIDNLPEHCFDIPIKKCFPGQDCDCNLPTSLLVCGNVITVTPSVVNQACCSDIGFGCDCGSEDPPGEHDLDCCGPTCPGSEICVNGQRLYNSLEQAKDAVWCECFRNAEFTDAATPLCSDCCCPDIESGRGSPSYPCDLLEPGDPLLQEDPPRCCNCPSANANDCCGCCLHFADGLGGTSLVKCRPEVDTEVEAIWSTCGTSPECPNPPCDTVDCPDPPCDTAWPLDEATPFKECRDDDCITGNNPLDPNRCSAPTGCISVKHPSTVVLNNGVGLVAYESAADISSIKIQQFKTSLRNKIMPNREFNFGRLQHTSRWSNNRAKLYYYENVATHLITSADTVDITQPDTWKDTIAFKNGPLARKIFPIANPTSGKDDVGSYISFVVPSDVKLSEFFPTTDDVYNIKWFIFNSEDDGLIGDAADNSTEGKSFIIDDHSVVDNALLLPPHTFSNEKVPVAHPCIAASYNYSNSLENSQFVYLTYQALEGGKWNIYLRQIRLSEYEREEQISEEISANNLVSITSLNLNEVIYRIVCVNDSCVKNGEQIAMQRSVVMQASLLDGREVFNPDLTGNWSGLCPGIGEYNFPKNKVFVQFIQSAATDRCAEPSDFDSVFYNWKVGQEFYVPFGSISAQNLFILLKTSDYGISTGLFEPPILKDNITIYSSSVSVIFYDNPVSSVWSVISNAAFDLLSKYKGMDISEPILLSNNDEGHSTHPIVRVNYNNDVFVTYETTVDTSLHQVKVVGTSTPASSLPYGVFRAKQIDATLNYFLSPSDFIYNRNITETNEGANQLPDMFIDMNDVVHLCWQSNRNGTWEIYYANSDNDFSPVRITNYQSRSLKPSINGDASGRLYIVWHDDRFGGYEIMMAHHLGRRILPLSEQDPYLASFRNHYDHSFDVIPIRIKNNNSVPLCISNIVVYFYEDRLLGKQSFSVAQQDYPFAFNIPGAAQDSSERVFDNFNSWSESITDPYDPYDPYDLFTKIITSPEYDTSLNGATVQAINLIVDLLSIDSSVEVSFRGSDTANDPIANSQWTDWATAAINGTNIAYSSLNISDSRGRYKQVRLRFRYPFGTWESPIPQYVAVTSISPYRLCLSPGEDVIVSLDMSPQIHIDTQQVVDFPIPVKFALNNTYFVSASIQDENGLTTTLPDMQMSVSCDTCSSDLTTWNYETCSVKFAVENNSDDNKYYNIECLFYSDKERENLLSSFSAFHNHADLIHFYVEDNQSAISKWSSRGLLITKNRSSTVVLWPTLSPDSGLLCGIQYYVDVRICSINDSDTELSCESSDMSVLYSFAWKCNCASPRWDPKFENAPVNINDIIRWKSSGGGFSDTRITETIGVSNLNPTMQIRSNSNGIIIYESNRTDQNASDDIYKLYSSAFSVVPSQNMYASGAESIISDFSQLVYKTDMPVIASENNSVVNGRNASFAIDQADEIFLAYEDSSLKAECEEFTVDKQQIIKVKTCGINNLDFSAAANQASTTSFCNSKSILGSTLIVSDPHIKHVVQQIRINDQYVKYYVTRSGSPVPVVSACLVNFEIIGYPESVAVRFRNGKSGSWSQWFPFSAEATDNSVTAPLHTSWKLSPGSGIKEVQMQISTYAGLTTTTSLSIVADYDSIRHEVKFYRPQAANAAVPPAVPDLSQDALWADSNSLPHLNKIPVASIRTPAVSDGSIQLNESDYIFIEIKPSVDYMKQFADISDELKASINGSSNSQIEPTFDFIQQGGNNQYNIPTIWARKAGAEVFRGVIIINRENQTTDIDGLASIVVHFKNDCSDVMSVELPSMQYTKDKYNAVVQGVKSEQPQSSKADALQPLRDISGMVKSNLVIRSNEDPHLIFGDPNYGLRHEQH